MKVLYLPLNYGMVVQSGIYDAFRDIGADLEIFDYYYVYEQVEHELSEVRKQFLNKVEHVQPDFLYMQIQHTHFIDGKAIAQAKKLCPKMIVANWTGDVRTYVPETFLDVGKEAHFNLISSTGQLEMFRKVLGDTVKYLQIGFNPKRHFPKENYGKFEWDAIFIANMNSTEDYPGRSDREIATNLLSKKFGNRYALFGNHWPAKYSSHGEADQKNVNDYYHKSFTAISVSHFNGIHHYFSDRLLMCMASGRPTISLEFPHWESYFTHDCDLVIAKSVEEIPQQVERLVKNKDLAEWIGKCGAQKVMAEHTYLSRIHELFQIVGLS